LNWTQDCELHSAGIVILESNDVILPQILAILNLDQNKWDDSGVFQAVACALGHISGLIGMQDIFVITTDNPSSARNDNPVFAPMVVHLQA
jgi:hypothetical protein